MNFLQCVSLQCNQTCQFTPLQRQCTVSIATPLCTSVLTAGVSGIFLWLDILCNVLNKGRDSELQLQF